MNIIIAQAPFTKRSDVWKRQQVRRPPLNMAGLGAYVRHQGFNVILFDFDTYDQLSLKECAIKILECNPIVVGFICLTPTFPYTVKLAKECKKLNKDVIIVFGGYHITGLPKRALKEECIDYGIIGEGELPFVKLLQYIDIKRDPRSINGIVYKKDDGTVFINKKVPLISDIDSLPFPAWDLLDIDIYREPLVFRGNHLGVMTGRGCAWNCNFCASKAIWGRKVRLHSPEYVFNEININVTKHNTKEFIFYDDTFTMNKKRVIKICNLIKDLGIKYSVNIRADTFDYEIAESLINSGCKIVGMGVESGNDDILKSIEKGITTAQVRDTANILRDVGLPFYAFFMIGHPGDTHETIRQTIDFANELRPNIAKFMISTPYPGTKLFDIAVKSGKMPEDGLDDLEKHMCFREVAVNLSNVSDDDLLKYQQEEAFDKYDDKVISLI